MFRLKESLMVNGGENIGDGPIRIRVNSSGDSIRDDSSTSYNVGTSGAPRTAEQTLPSV